jgi:hypothetical protein
MEEPPNFEKAGDEVVEIEKLPPISIEISPLQILGMITLIQVVVMQHPDILNDGWGKIGVETARHLQSQGLFDRYPEVCKMLDFGWHPELLVTPETVANMLLDINARQQEQNIISDKHGDAGSSETVAKRIARGLLNSQGYLDI